MAASTMRPAAPVWRAGADGDAHAIVARGDRRYACGERVLDERFAHPTAGRGRCIDCLVVVGIDVTARDPGPALSESEHRLMDGNR